MTALPLPKRYEHINFTAPKGVLEELRRGLAWHEEGESGDGLKPATVAEARRIVNEGKATFEKARRMAAWLARHEVDKEGEGFTPGEDGFPSPGRVAWALWGGDAAVAWSGKLVEQMEAADRAAKGDTYADAEIRADGALLAPMRYDRASAAVGVTLDAPEAGPAGSKVYHAVAIHAPCLLRYEQADGSTFTELVLPETLRRSDASLKRVSATLEHPSKADGWEVTPDNATRLTIGDVGGDTEIRESGGKVYHLTRTTVRDATAQAEIDSGRKAFVSMGYRPVIDPTPGEYPGLGRYDAIQIDREYNHEAFVGNPRGGADCRVQLDSVAFTAEQVRALVRVDSADTGGLTPMKEKLIAWAAGLGIAHLDGLDESALLAKIKAKTDEIEVEMKEMEGKPDLSSKVAELEAKIAELAASLAEMTTKAAEADGMKAELDQMKADAKAAQVKARADALTAKAKALGLTVAEGATVDSLSAAIIEKGCAGFKIDGLGLSAEAIAKMVDKVAVPQVDANDDGTPPREEAPLDTTTTPSRFDATSMWCNRYSA